MYACQGAKGWKTKGLRGEKMVVYAGDGWVGRRDTEEARLVQCFSLSLTGNMTFLLPFSLCTS